MRRMLSFRDRTPGRWSWWVRRRIRSPFLYWAAAAAVGLLTASSVARTLQAAEAERDRYGRWASAVVATRDLPAGRALTADDVRTTRLPVAMVPRSAWRGEVSGRRLRQAVVANEVLVRQRIVAASSPVAARLHDGHRAVGVPRPEAALAVRIGDRVDIADLGADTGAYTTVAANLEVVAVTDRLVTVAVPRDDVAAVQGAVAAGTVQLSLVGAADPALTDR